MTRRCKIKSILWPITVMFLLVYSSKLDYIYIQLSLALLLHFDSSVKYSHEAFISGRGSRLAGFDAPFNMGSARCKIEWNDNFEAIYLQN